MQTVTPRGLIQEHSMLLLSSTLIKLYEAAEHLGIGEYPQAMMQAIGCLISFDGGMFSTVNGNTLALQQAHIFRRSTSLASDLIPLLSQDPVAQCLLHGVDAPIICNCERFYNEHGLFRQDRFYRRHHIARMLLFGDAPGHGRNGQGIALFRSTGDSFGEAERQSLIAVWPHIVRAIKSNHRHCLERQVVEREGRAAALMNQEGMIEEEDAGFRAALLDEWPQFSEKRVPDAVLQCWHAGMAFIGERIRISMRAQREYVLCHARRYSAPGILTRSERMVAYQFANGLSHKQVAKNLGISQNTVRSHIAHVYEKLDVHNKAALANVFAAESFASQ